MKRLWLAAAVLLLLLCGCRQEKPEQTTTVPVQTTLPTQPPVTEPAVEDPGLYDPDSPVEQLTGGAVRAYPISGENVLNIVPAGDRLLMLSSCDTGVRATVLSGDNCVVTAQALLNGCTSTQEGTLRASQNRIVYYDGGGRSVVILDESLSETERILLPEQILGEPVISEDMTTVFYCTEDKIHALDMATGTSRLIRQQSCHWQTLQRTLFDDSVLECYMIDDDMETSTCFISAETGQLLGSDISLRQLSSFGDNFFLIRDNGYLPEYLFGTQQGQLQALYPQEDYLYSALSMNGVLGRQETEEGTALSLYDLESGKRRACVLLPQVLGVYDVAVDAAGRYVWLSVYDREKQQDVLYRWESALSETDSSEVFTGPRYTRDNPDAEGLALCAEQARSLGEAYGVEIFLGEEIIAPWDYTLTTEYRVEALELGLSQLEMALASYPEDFLTTMVEETATGVIRISLVRDISDGVSGVQYWIEGDAYIALEISDSLQQHAYHEICHVLDNYIIANCYAYDDWEDLNPEGAQYDYSYHSYQGRTDWTWLEGDNKAFIDSYSMTYPKEDRARIMEYAMMPGNAESFRSEYLQSKLLKICEGIRESFGYERYEGTFPWEQYLNTSLAYKKK